jgi:hypothetical protein
VGTGPRILDWTRLDHRPGHHRPGRPSGRFWTGKAAQVLKGACGRQEGEPEVAGCWVGCDVGGRCDTRTWTSVDPVSQMFCARIRVRSVLGRPAGVCCFFRSSCFCRRHLEKRTTSVQQRVNGTPQPGRRSMAWTGRDDPSFGGNAEDVLCTGRRGGADSAHADWRRVARPATWRLPFLDCASGECRYRTG